MKQTIILCGQFLDFSGYAWAVRAYAKLFVKKFDNVLFCDASQEKRTKGMNEEQILEFKRSLKIENINFCNNKTLSELEGEVFYFECLLPSINVACFVKNLPTPLDELNNNDKIKIKKISMIAWESNKIPDFFMQGLVDYEFDHAMFHSPEHIDELQTQLSIPCSYNHYPVMELFNPTRKEEGDEMFRILSFNDYQPRKGWATLLNSYYSTFFYNEDVILRIKTHGNLEKIHSNITQFKESNAVVSFLKNKLGKYEMVKEYPKCKVELDLNFLTEDEINSYYSKFDLFACTTKGEGFGLTIAQAGLSGLPILCPKRGGHTYFIPEVCYMPDTFTCAIPPKMPPQFYTGKTMHLYECDYLSTKSEFKRAYNDWREGNIRQKGVETKEFMENELSTENCFKNILKVMEELK